MKKLFAIAGAVSLVLSGSTNVAAQQRRVFTHADSLRGSIGPARAWWDVSFYDLHVRVNPKDSSISGVNRITFRMLELRTEMQLDLQQPMVMDSVVWGAHRALAMRRDGNAYFVTFPTEVSRSKIESVIAYFHGKPRVATHAPWDGGFVWARDSLGNRWIATANQGLG